MALSFLLFCRYGSIRKPAIIQKDFHSLPVAFVEKMKSDGIFHSLFSGLMPGKRLTLPPEVHPGHLEMAI
ncbi:MAG: hypothetical protein IMW88_07100 [Thermoflavifilum sp.]|uniref:hypothetical protein n=1 Tax=Thermoflavifilum sp. TaxID=1968839 RepID=UPI0018A54339|nr:hypothetical protein [Thermoflavifilum sp.]QOR75143.1 MAG: hypothetical protein IMW88_07100 [Thermoflavifilum sp.]